VPRFQWIAMTAATCLAACSSTGYPIIVGKDATGQDVYAIDGYPKMDDVSTPKAARYCQQRGQVMVVRANGYQGEPFTFQCNSAN
jgi:hypothetical protein